MRHRLVGRKFGRVRGKRKSFVSILMHNLIMEGKIQTTEARAKEIRPLVEKLVTIAKKGDLAATRLLLKRVPEDSVHKLCKEIAPRYKDRNGGYLRIIKTAEVRKRDGVETVIIEFV